MTRMLLTLLFSILLLGSLTSCGLFEGTPDDAVTLDTAKVDDDDLGDDLEDDSTEEDLSDEAEDLTGEGDDDSDEEEALQEEEEVAEDDPFGGEEDFDIDELEDGDLDLEEADLDGTEEFEGELSDNDISFDEESAIEAESTDTLEGGSAQVLDLQYRAFEGGGTIAIVTNEQVEYEVRDLPDTNQLVIEVADVDLPESLKRPYITKDFYQDVAIINAYQDPGNTTARFIVQFNKAVEPSVAQDGNTILVRSDQSLANLASNTSESKSGGGTSLEEQSAETSNLRTKELRKKYQPMSREGVFTGRKIHIELDDVDVKEAITLIAEQSGANIIIDSGVSGKISIKLRQVPWDQALSVILKANGLGFVRQANVLRIATQEKLTREAQNLKQFLEDQKQAKMAAAGMKVKMIPVSYSKVKELEKQLKNFLSKEGKVTSDPRTSSLVITDYQEFVDRAESVIKSIDTPPRQVLIEAKIVEARDTFNQQIGVNWQAVGERFGSASGGSGIGGSFNVGNGRTAPPGGLGFDMNVGTISVLGDIEAALGLAVQENEAKILSSPRVVVLNNTQSEIKQVTQVPIRQVTTTQTGTVDTVTFVDLQLSLNVMPQITFAGDVILDVDLSRDFAGAATGTQGAREINKRSAKTKVLVKNGQTAVLGGIYQSDATVGEEGTPLLKDIPILGYLFKSKTKEKNKNELAIFIKPTILDGGNTNSMANAGSLKPADDPEDLGDAVSEDLDDLEDLEGDDLDGDLGEDDLGDLDEDLDEEGEIL